MTDLGSLDHWWYATAGADFEMVGPKAKEYGSRDLTEMGHSLARVAGRDVSDAEATEMGIWFYALGKMARWTAAVERGERVSVDTLTDLGVYAKMARRVRETGSWPGEDPASYQADTIGVPPIPTPISADWQCPDCGDIKHRPIPCGNKENNESD